MSSFRRAIFILPLLLLLSLKVNAQEFLLPLNYNPIVKDAVSIKNKSPRKTTAITLPFFEDFTDYSPIPNPVNWVDRKVYVNNTMCDSPISRGVATFDAINQYGYPYELVNSNVKYADSLTSQKIDLSTYTPSDSLYLSFFYQPQGKGFYPETEDSLMLFLRSTNGWDLVWKKEGSVLQPFKQIMIAIKSATYFHDGFQFRFINKASMVLNDDVWNLDYIRLAANRNINDTAITDVAYTLPPSSLLKEYTSMPYHQYLADASAERAPDMETFIRNNSATANNINHNFVAVEPSSSTSLSTSTGNVLTLSPYNSSKVTFPVYTNIAAAPQKHHPITFENKYYIESVSANDTKGNDTIIHYQDFHNYLAYDDGTAEKSYFLNQFSTLPGKIAIEFHLNEPDTLNGISIYFGRQLAFASQKYFSVAVYSDIAFGGGTDKLLFQEDFLNPVYSVVNHMWTYQFNKPVPLPAGTFYIGTIQPALSSSDSLYFGVDVNRVGSNHLYYNVLNTWQSSNVSGALMMRPVFGTVTPSDVSTITNDDTEWSIIPNPARSFVTIKFNNEKKKRYEIIDISGVVVKEGIIESDNKIEINKLLPGTYFISLYVEGLESSFTKKLIKY